MKAKDGAGSATLSMAYAGYRFAERVLQAVKGKDNIVEPTFVYLPGVDGGDAIVKETGCNYFSMPVEIGKDGAKKIENILPKATEYEQKLLKKCYEDLKGNIDKGIDFVKNPPPKEEKK